jgi:3-dehydrosphinganine reductase
MNKVKWGRTFITGGSSGIGYAAAEQLLKEGADVVLFARNRERLNTAVNALASAAGIPGSSVKERVACQVLDISDVETSAKIVQKALETYGPPKTIICSAGISYPDHFWQLPENMIVQTIQTNLIGTILFIRRLLPSMSAGSRIAVVSSVAGCVGTYGYTAYSASKFGLIGFAQALRNEMVCEGICVTVLCPPDTDTPQLHQENKTKPPETFAISGTIKPLTPEKVASSLITGLGKGQFMVIPGLEAKAVCTLSRLFPAFVQGMMDRTVRKARRRLGITKRLSPEKAGPKQE